MGDLDLPPELAPGAWRILSPAECESALIQPQDGPLRLA
jgi:hypothetical protein